MSAAADAQEAALSIDSLIDKLKIPSEDVFVASFVELGYSTTASRQKRLVRYILERHYSHHCTGSMPDFEQMTIEHLVPESAASGSRFTLEDIASIGNLILVDEQLNGDLDDKPFKEKLPVLKAARQVWIDPNVLNATTWGRKAIDQRVTTVAHEAYQTIWM